MIHMLDTWWLFMLWSWQNLRNYDLIWNESKVSSSRYSQERCEAFLYSFVIRAQYFCWKFWLGLSSLGVVRSEQVERQYIKFTSKSKNQKRININVDLSVWMVLWGSERSWHSNTGQTRKCILGVADGLKEWISFFANQQNIFYTKILTLAIFVCIQVASSNELQKNL